jgi:hypothetical protein
MIYDYIYRMATNNTHPRNTRKHSLKLFSGLALVKLVDSLVVFQLREIASHVMLLQVVSHTLT